MYMSKKFFTENEIKNDPNTFVYDPYENSENVVNLPNVPELLNQIIYILEYMNTDNIIKLKSENFEEYTQHMETKYFEFSNRYFGLFQKLISGEDITPLVSMLGAIENVKSGQISIEQAEESLGDMLAEEYIYPHLTKKQKKDIKNTLNNELKKKK